MRRAEYVRGCGNHSDSAAGQGLRISGTNQRMIAVFLLRSFILATVHLLLLVFLLFVVDRVVVLSRESPTLLL